MMLRCPSCAVRLRLKEQTAAARSAAKCPQCGGTVPLKAQDNEVIKVLCGSCGVRLKAPAGSEGTRSACPRCKADITIGAPAPSPEPMTTPLAARTRQEESSGASTRRMDSRNLGLSSLGASAHPAGDMDLDAFVKSKEPQADARETMEGFESPNLAAALMNPPVKELERLAGEIRQAAAGFDPAAVHSASHAASPAVVAEEPELGSPVARDSRAPRPSHPVASMAKARPFPATRGLILGASAGLVVGAVSAAAVKLAGPGALNYVSPLPLAGGTGGLPDMMLQVALPGLLASISGFIAAAAGSPSLEDRPLRLTRTLGFSLLAGLACGSVTGLSVPEGISAWPIVSWSRDLLAAGILTTALHSLIPQRRS